MPTTEQTLALLRAHAARGMEKHPDFLTTGDALRELTNHLGRARAALTPPVTATADHDYCKALAQVGGLVIKAFINLDLELVPPRSDADDASTPLAENADPSKPVTQQP